MDDTEPMEAAHGGDVFACPDCEKSFSKRTSLAAHKASVHSSRPTSGGHNGGRPRKDRQPAAPTPRGPGRPRARKPIKSDIELTFKFAAQVWAMRDPVCAPVLEAQATQIAASWDAWAARSPRVQQFWETTLEGAGLVGVIAAHVPVVIVVLQHHGPQRHLYFMPAEGETVEGPQEPEPAWANGGPVASGYAPASADNAR